MYIVLGFIVHFFLFTMFLILIREYADFFVDETFLTCIVFYMIFSVVRFCLSKKPGEWIITHVSVIYAGSALYLLLVLIPPGDCIFETIIPPMNYHEETLQHVLCDFTRQLRYQDKIAFFIICDRDLAESKISMHTKQELGLERALQSVLKQCGCTYRFYHHSGRFCINKRWAGWKDNPEQHVYIQ